MDYPKMDYAAEVQSIAITQTHLLCQMQANSFWAEFLTTIFKGRKRKKIQPSLVFVPHKKWNWLAFSRRSRVVQWRQRNVQKSVMHVKSCCLLPIQPVAFLTSLCRRRRGILKSLFQLLQRLLNLPYPPSVSSVTLTSLLVFNSCYANPTISALN